jgi:hypothetical protein
MTFLQERPVKLAAKDGGEGGFNALNAEPCPALQRLVRDLKTKSLCEFCFSLVFAELI